VDLKNQAEGLIYTTKKSLEEFGNRLEEADRKLIADRLKVAEELAEGTDVDKLKKAVDQLSEAAHKLAEAVYSQVAQKMGKE
jgi:molecular chaperone DnaK